MLDIRSGALSASTTEEIDDALAGYLPFGSSDYIRKELHFCLARRLGKVAAAAPAAAELARRLDGAGARRRHLVYGDTAVRAAVQYAMREVVTGVPSAFSLADCDQLFTAALGHLTAGDRRGPTEVAAGSAARLGPEPGDGWIWTEDRADDVFGRAFRHVVRENYGSGLWSPTPAEVGMLQSGTRLLRDLLPALAGSALSHARIVALFHPEGAWEATGSSSTFRVGGTVFLNHELLANPWWVAEHLFHEALHQKLYDFRHGHQVLSRDSAPDRHVGAEPAAGERARVVVPWNSPGLTAANAWDTHRALAAFHVYTHLCLLCAVAEQRAGDLAQTYGPPDAAGSRMTGSRAALDRARFLGTALRGTCWAELGPAGRLLVRWLWSVLDAVDPVPPPAGADLHLLLHRYRTEAAKVARWAPRAGTEQLRRIAEEELRVTTEVLAALGATDELTLLRRRSGTLPCDRPAEHLRDVRELIEQSLRRAAPSGYALARPASSPRDPNATIRDMVDASSRRLAEIAG